MNKITTSKPVLQGRLDRANQRIKLYEAELRILRSGDIGKLKERNDDLLLYNQSYKALNSKLQKDNQALRKLRQGHKEELDMKDAAERRLLQ